MRKTHLILVLAFLALLVLSACSLEINIGTGGSDDDPGDDEPIACTADAKICPDGTVVGRVGPDCEFAECPSVNKTDCDYDDPEKKYIEEDAESCQTIRFACADGMKPFSNECGCGCEPAEDDSDMERVFCKPEQRDVDACIEIYQPVCGWFDPDRIQCVRYPCAQTYSNSCFACDNPDVLYYTAGECPE